MLLMLVVFAGSAAGGTQADRSQASALFSQGMSLYQMQDYQGAIACWEKAAALFRQLGMDKEAADAANALGVVSWTLARSQQAIGDYEQALATYQKLGLEQEAANTLNNLALALCALGSYERAASYYERALAVYRKLGLGEREADALNNLGLLAATLSQHSKAAEYYEQARAAYHKLKLERKEADTLHNLGLLAWSLAQHDKARNYYQQALVTYRKLGLRKQEGDALNNLGLVAWSVAEYQQAQGYYRQALAIRHELGLQKDEADTLNGLGLVASDLSEYDQAADLYGQALSTRRRLGLEMETAETLSNLGTLAMESARYEQALDYLKQALAAYQRLGLERQEAEVLSNLGLVSYHLARYGEALGCYQRALDTWRRLSLPKDEADTLSNLGALVASLGQGGRALEHYQRALAIRRKLRLQKEEALTLNNLGVVAESSFSFDQALAYYEQASAICRRLGLAKETRMMQLNTAEVYVAQGRLTEARAILEREASDPLRWGRYYLLSGDPREAGSRFQQAAAVVGETFSSLVASHIGLGLAQEALGEWQQAAAAYTKAVELIEQARLRTPPAERGRFFEAKDYGFPRLEAYEGLVRVLHRLGKDDEAFLWSEHTKARALVEALARVPYGTPVGLPAELRQQEDDLTNRVAALSKRLEEKPEQRAMIEEQLKPVQAELEALIARLRREYPEYASMKYPQPLHANELALRSGEVLLAYEVTEPETIAFLVRGGKVERSFEIKLKREELTKLIAQHRQQFERVEYPTWRTDLKAVDLGLSHRLYELLLKDPLSHIEAGEQVVIVPDEGIGLLPLEGLVESLPAQITWQEGEHSPTPQGVGYVGDRFSFSYWQSGTSLSMVRRLRKGAGGERVLVVADPVFDVADARLAGTAIAQAPKTPAGEFNLMREVRDGLTQSYGQAIFRRLAITGSLPERLRAVYGDKLTAWVGLEAKESKLKREPLQAYGQILFGTHGVLDESVPWLQQPALVLSLVGNEPGEDGYLTLAEVMDLKLRAQVVGLMACDSGTGRVLSGEGVMGMGRAFQYAGASSVLASLWSVEDESTNLLAEEFLRALQQGQDKAQALSSARHTLRQSGYDHPFFWTPFVLIGERESGGP
jgi:tetratricopeptide (TPR) repeat protein